MTVNPDVERALEQGLLDELRSQLDWLEMNTSIRSAEEATDSAKPESSLVRRAATRAERAKPLAQ